MESYILKVLKIIHLSENLKMEKRHSWLSNGDQESVAEHSWRLSLMILLIAPRLKTPINLEKTLIMAIIHDLVEAKVGDKPDFNIRTQIDQETKYQLEEQSMKEIAEELDRSDLFEIWKEFEEGVSLEAKFVRALDRMESQIQHNESNIDTWLDIEKKRQYLGYKSYSMHDEALNELSDACCKESREKLSQSDKEKISSWMKEKKLKQCLEEVGIKGFYLDDENEQ
ncbi:MAG: hypothetical protein S4CHLAM6_12950 [Chlamydiae bacterium]|nr:hypothetical protein [Chlamydiota bacterium]